MKKSLLILLTISVSIFSCKKDFATFQGGSQESFTSKKSSSIPKLTDKEFDEVIASNTIETVVTEENVNVSASANEVVTPIAENTSNATKTVSVKTVDAKLTPSVIKEVTGKSLTFSQIKKLKQLQKIAKKSSSNNAEGGKSQIVALILAIVVGGLGIHRFYLGYTTYGIIQLLTLGGCGVWALIDIINIALGNLKPNGGDYDQKL